LSWSVVVQTVWSTFSETPYNMVVAVCEKTDVKFLLLHIVGKLYPG